MRLGKYYFKMIKEFVKNILFNLAKKKNGFAPIFIIGCGRSGTTILGETLSKHPDIKYLNERRDLWHRAYPNFDIWGADVKKAQLFADKTDVNPQSNTLLRALFFREQALGNAKILIEKLPINNFRLDFLKKSFPEAKYIYLSRNGLEVSKSIEKSIKKEKWFLGGKLNLLKKNAEKNGINFDLEAKSEIHQGMLEWKLSMSESHFFFKNSNDNLFTHLSYEDFVENTEIALKQIFNFLNIDYSKKLIDKLAKGVNRKNKKICSTDDPVLEKIGGNILSKTINNTYSPF